MEETTMTVIIGFQDGQDLVVGSDRGPVRHQLGFGLHHQNHAEVALCDTRVVLGWSGDLRTGQAFKMYPFRKVKLIGPEGPYVHLIEFARELRAYLGNERLLVRDSQGLDMMLGSIFVGVENHMYRIDKRFTVISGHYHVLAVGKEHRVCEAVALSAHILNDGRSAEGIVRHALKVATMVHEDITEPFVVTRHHLSQRSNEIGP